MNVANYWLSLLVIMISFLYFLVPGKSLACQFESLLINQLSGQGFQLSNIANGKHRNFGTSNLYT